MNELSARTKLTALISEKPFIRGSISKRKLTCGNPTCKCLQECLSYLGGKQGDMPVSEHAAKTSLALPVYPEITSDALKYVADSVLEFIK